MSTSATTAKKPAKKPATKPATKRSKKTAEATAKARRGDQGRSSNRTFMAIVVAIVVLIAVAIVTTRDQGGGNEVADDLQQTAAIEISGDALPVLPEEGEDPAVGAEAPVLSGEDFQGDPVTVGGDGRAKILVYMAHWCSHCQSELPVLNQWVAGGSLPEDVDLVAVVTGTDETLPNYPPSEWLLDGGWTEGIILDDPSGSAANAYGLTGTPFWAFVREDGTVAARTSGGIGPEVLDAAVAELAR